MGLLEPSTAEREDAELYRLLHTGTPGDIAFYVEACRGASHVLELGTGFGRLLRPLAGVADRVTSIDIHRGLLALAAAELDDGLRDRVRVLEQDMRRLDLEERFDRVLIPFSALFALSSPADMRTTLRRARAHMRPGAVLLLDVYAVDDAACVPETPSDTGWEPVREVRWRGRDATVHERNIVPGPACRIDVHYRLDVPGERAIEQRIRHHFLSWSMLRSLLEACGFKEIHGFGDFMGGPLREDRDVTVISADA